MINVPNVKKVQDIPFIKHSEGDPNPPLYTDSALNTGIVEVKCIIDRFCPFFKSELYKQSIIFNDDTSKNLGIVKDGSLLTNTKNVPGLHLKPRLIHRSNFIIEEGTVVSVDSSEDSDSFTPLVSFGETEETEEASTSSGHITGFVEDHFEDCKYRNEFLWKISDSMYTIYDDPNNPNLSKVNVPDLNSWEYQNLPNPLFSSYINGEIENDYISKKKPTSIHMPVFFDIKNDSEYGSHWKIDKVTPIYDGADIFFEFHRKSNLDSAKKEEESNANLTVTSEKYFCLDKNFEGKGELPKYNGGRYHENGGVVSYSINEEYFLKETPEGETRKDAKYEDYKKIKSDLDFTSQSYLIIDINSGIDNSNDPKYSSDRYALIITKNSPPRLIQIINYGHLSYANGRSFSRVLGIYSGSIDSNKDKTADSLSSLLDAKWFRVNIRNMLGRLAISFEGDGVKTDDWIVSKQDFIPEANSAKSVESPMILKGNISIMGGNYSVGFNFGYIQYQTEDQGGDKMSVNTIFPYKENNQGNVVEVRLDDGLFFLANNKDKKFVSLKADTRERLISEKESVEDVYPSDSQMIQEYLPNELGVSEEVRTTNVIGYEKLMKEEARTTHVRLDMLSSIIIDGEPISVFEKITEEDSHVPYKIKLKLRAGSHIFYRISKINTHQIWELWGCKTPILTTVTYGVLKDEEDRWTPDPKDVSEHVMSYNDSWMSEDFHFIEHSGKIQFLINEGSNFNDDYTDYLYSLRNKAFYIEVWAGYKEISGIDDCNYSKIPGLYKMITGICYGGSVTMSAGKRILDCKIFDYTKILQDILIFNSPFFDGQYDIDAVYDLLEMSGLKDNEEDAVTGTYGCSHIIKNQSLNAKDGILNEGEDATGRKIRFQPWNLPSGFDKLHSQYYKFGNGENILDSIKKISKDIGKLFFIDEYGIAHYENYFESVLCSLKGDPDSSITLPVLFKYTNRPDQYIGYQQVFESFSVTRDVQSIFNNIKIETANPNGEILMKDISIDNGKSLNDPKKVGFLGYRKLKYQAEGIIGNEAAIKNIAYFYAKFFSSPPIVINFKSYGLPLRPLDIISFNDQPFRVIRVESNIIAQENSWKQDIECEWFRHTQEV